MPVPKGYREKSAGYPAKKCAPRSFRVKILNSTKRIVVCCPKGKWSGNRCRVGTRGVKVQTKSS